MKFIYVHGQEDGGGGGFVTNRKKQRLLTVNSAVKSIIFLSNSVLLILQHDMSQANTECFSNESLSEHGGKRDHNTHRPVLEEWLFSCLRIWLHSS